MIGPDAGIAAMLDTPRQLTADSTGHVYIADAGNNQIRRLSPAGVLETIAGTGQAGQTNGRGPDPTFILPTGLGVFARLAPAGYASTTIAAWYFASFGGNLLAGVLGMLWSELGHAAFFAVMALVAAAAGTLLRLLDGAVLRAEAGNGAGHAAVAGERPAVETA